MIPLFNGAAHIEETLTSIGDQTVGSIEVIVVDDGSTDDGAALARQHPIGATVLTQANLGVAVARNRGLAATRTRWVAFVDQDDMWHPSHIARALVWLNAHPDERIVFLREIPFTVVDDEHALNDMDALAGGWAHLRVSSTATLTELVARGAVAGSDRVRRYDVRAMLRGPISTTTSFIADADLLRLAGGFAPHALAMDDYWMLVNVARLAPIPQLDQPTVFYRVHTGATSRTTELGLPFLSSAVALRLGGGLIPLEEGTAGRLDGDLHRHLLTELLASQRYGDRRFRGAVDALARTLWPPDGRRVQRLRARLRARLPWLRRIRRRGRGGGS
ncbi:hypothetical protein GCM10022200_18410 [Microbacterium awajiense]|uniref:Glycosyltransferase 2-like domain-containing protein n=1 Tax=Microbacterium awajiense TaxID=415214 RepID=A0ABP7AMP2_9MICO